MSVIFLQSSLCSQQQAKNFLNTSNLFHTLEMATFLPTSYTYVPTDARFKSATARSKPASKQAKQCSTSHGPTSDSS
jgi:hypothetical protein